MKVRNPFPGMNPFLEQRWKDFHGRYTMALGAALNESLPSDLVARTETDLYVTADQYERTITPDAYVADFGLRRGGEADLATGGGGSSATTVAPKPVKVRVRSEPARVHRIEIRESGEDGRVVTAIELFSPTNKFDRRGRQQYERKREEYLSAGVSLVEIDLLRGGPHLVAAPPEVIPPQVRKTYKVCVVRRPDEEPADESAFELYGAGLDEPLPPVSVPLRPSDADVTLNLQAALDEAFRQGKYIDLRYDREPDPPFTDDERRVVREHVGGLSKP